MPTFKIGESTLYYELHGEGEPLLLAHGVGGNHAIWYQQTAVLSKSYQVILLDQRGFGRSSDVEGLGRAAFADDLERLLDHLEIQRVALVGQSMGGGTCVGFAARHPARVAAVVLASTLHGLSEPPEVAGPMDAARAATADLSQLERVLSSAYRDANPAGAVLYAAISSFNAANRRNLAGAWPELLAPEALGNLGAPVMFIAGTEDVLFPIGAVRAMQAHVPGSYLVEIVGAGHSAFFEQPQEFNDSVLSFLQAAGVRPKRRPAHSNAAGYVPVASN